jgi:hypothetical protein
MTELFFVPNLMRCEPTLNQTVRCLMPSRTVLGRRFQVFSAKRIGQCEWELTYGKHRIFGWPEPPLFEKAVRGDAKRYNYVRETHIVFPTSIIPVTALGPDVRIVAYSQTIPPLPGPKADVLSRYVRRVWYLSALDWRDGVTIWPDETCVNPRKGPVRMPRSTPEQIVFAQKEHAAYCEELDARAKGWIFHPHNHVWLSREQYAIERKHADDHEAFRRRAGI